MRKADMIDIRDILRQRHELGLARNDIAAAVGVNAGTVSNVLRRAEAAGLSCWPLPDGLDDEALRERLYPQRTERDSGHVQPDWEAIVKEYRAPPGRRRARLTQRQLWVEYSEEAMAQITASALTGPSSVATAVAVPSRKITSRTGVETRMESPQASRRA